MGGEGGEGNVVQAREKGDYKKCPYIIIYTDFSIIFVGTYWLPCTSMKMYKDTQITMDGKAYTRIMYPKFKNGEEVVREVAVPPTYGKKKAK